MRTLASTFVAMLLVGCGSTQAPPAKDPAPAGTQPAVTDISYAKDIQPIFTQSCMPCHAGGKDAKAGYDLTSHAEVTGSGSNSIPNVIPGNADSSLLYRRLTGAVQPQMPKGRPPLNADQLTTIKKWIDQGAKNN